MAFLDLLTAENAVRGGLTPTFQLTASKDFARFLQLNNLNYDAESSILWLMTEALSSVLGNNAPIPRPPGDPADLCASLVPAADANADAAVRYFAPAGALDQVIKEGIPPLAMRALLLDAPRAPFWLLDLTACHQVKPIKAANVSSFFKMTSRVTINGREIMKVLDFAAVAIPKILDDAALRPHLGDNTFMDYHTSYSSTAGLVASMLSSAPTVTHVMFSDATWDAVNASVDDPSDRELNAAIPQSAVVATHAYLVVNGRLPDNWYQGEKAVSSAPASRYNYYRMIFKKIKDISADAEAIDAVRTTAALIAILDPAFIEAPAAADGN